MLTFLLFSISGCLAAPQWSDLTREIALESDRRLMSDQEQSVLIDQLLSDVKRLKRENQVLSEQFFNFVEEEHVHKMQLNKRSKNRIRKLSDTLFRTIQTTRHTRQEVKELKRALRKAVNKKKGHRDESNDTTTTTTTT